MLCGGLAARRWWRRACAPPIQSASALQDVGVWRGVQARLLVAVVEPRCAAGGGVPIVQCAYPLCGKQLWCWGNARAHTQPARAHRPCSQRFWVFPQSLCFSVSLLQACFGCYCCAPCVHKARVLFGCVWSSGGSCIAQQSMHAHAAHSEAPNTARARARQGGAKGQRGGVVFGSVRHARISR